MGLRCGDAFSRLFGETTEGVYLDVQWQCMRATCERCWQLLLNRRIWATRIAMQKLGVSDVWLGLLDKAQRNAARQWKFANKNRADLLVMNALSTYRLNDNVGMFATCNYLPNQEATLVQMSLEDGLSTYYRWAIEYRPKRITADWDLKLEGVFTGKFTADTLTITELWRQMSERWGYKPGDVPDDPATFERRMYMVLDEIKNPFKSSDDDMYDGQ